MARSYNRDSKGRFAPTGGTKATAVGRGRRAPSNIGRARSIGGRTVIQSRSVAGSQKGRIQSSKINAGATRVSRAGLQVSRSGKSVSPVRTDSYVSKLKKGGYGKNAPSHRAARAASGARGVQVGKSAIYVSRTEARRVPGANVISRSNVRRAGSGLPRSGYIVNQSAQRVR